MHTEEIWEVHISRADDRVLLRRKTKDGRVEESYCPVEVHRAAVYLSAIIQGFEPPRCLMNLDKLVGQTQFEQDHHP